MQIGKSIWLSSRKNELNSEIPEYEFPIEIVTRTNYFTVMPSSTGGFMEVVKNGENLYNYWRATANGRYFNGKIKVGDVVWLDGEKPIQEIENEYGIGASATAIVDSVEPVNFTLSIRLKRNQKQVLQ